MTIALLTILCFVNPVFAQWDVQVLPEVYLPNNGLLNKAVGSEVKLAYWQTPRWGLAFCTGVSNWTVDTTRDIMISIPDTYERSRLWQGHIQYVPVGLSLLARSEAPQRTVLLEAGIRRLIATSNIDLLETDHVWTGPGTFTDSTAFHPVDCPDGLVGRLGIGGIWALNDQLDCVVAGGYQIDMDRGNATVDSLSVHKELDLTAVYFQLGFVLKLQ